MTNVEFLGIQKSNVANMEMPKRLQSTSRKQDFARSLGSPVEATAIFRRRRTISPPYAIRYISSLTLFMSSIMPCNENRSEIAVSSDGRQMDLMTPKVVHFIMITADG
jgi:hypothetical protein